MIGLVGVCACRSWFYLKRPWCTLLWIRQDISNRLPLSPIRRIIQDIHVTDVGIYRHPMAPPCRGESESSRRVWVCHSVLAWWVYWIPRHKSSMSKLWGVFVRTDGRACVSGMLSQTAVTWPSRQQLDENHDLHRTRSWILWLLSNETMQTPHGSCNLLIGVSVVNASVGEICNQQSTVVSKLQRQWRNRCSS